MLVKIQTLPKCTELTKACKDPSSAECQRERDLQKSCENEQSAECKKAQRQKACEDPDSSQCKRAEACTEPGNLAGV